MMSITVPVQNRVNLPAAKKWSGLWYALFTLPFLAALAFSIFQPIQVLPRISLSPGFALTDQDGKRLTNEDLRGHLVLYNFTYTNCVAPCPPTSAALRAVQQQLSQINTRGVPVDLVTISFDPIRDQPAQLRAYATKLGADTTNWHFVSGTPLQLKNVIGGGFGAFYQARADGAFTFDPQFVLVDGVGIIRAKYRTSALEPTIIQRDIELITAEARNSKGAAKFAYEAAHLFLCYPK